MVLVIIVIPLEDSMNMEFQMDSMLVPEQFVILGGMLGGARFISLPEGMGREEPSGGGANETCSWMRKIPKTTRIITIAPMIAPFLLFYLCSL